MYDYVHVSHFQQKQRAVLKPECVRHTQWTHQDFVVRDGVCANAMTIKGDPVGIV